MNTIPMSTKELKYVEIIPRVIAHELKGVEAAKLLGITDRTVRRLKAAVKENGSSVLAHKARGRASNHRIPEKERKKIEGLLIDKYHDFTPTFAAEKLDEIHGLKYDRKTIGKLMIEIGLKEPARSVGSKTVHRNWREPRARFGELVQFDGSYHEWFEGRVSGKQCLLAAIDDATGNITHLALKEHEGVLPVLAFWKEYALKYGLPQAIYVDKFSTYKMNQKTLAENPDLKTQFSRVMEGLRTNVIFANSSQAKGRVERLFRTLQDRLIKELRIQNISTVSEANRFFEDVFVPDFNKRFGRSAREVGNLHRLLETKERHRADDLFCRHDERTICHDFTISHNTVWYQLLPTSGVAIRPRDICIVRTHTDGCISIAIRGKIVQYKIVAKTVGRKTINYMLPAKLRTLAPALI
jgi:transposase/transposase-like protein